MFAEATALPKDIASGPLDALDLRILEAVRQDGRITNARLAEVVGLSPSACLRRLKLLEHRGVIRGYTALIQRPGAGRRATFFAEIVLERQTDEYFSRFETEIRRCPDVLECYLMTGDYDYLLRVEAADPADYERVHRDLLARLPGVARIRTSFAIRRIVTQGE